MSIAPQLNHKTLSESRLVSDSFDNKLDVGEVLTGTVTVNEVTTSDLTLSNASVSTTALTINGKVVPAGRAIQYLVVGGTLANSPYLITANCVTDSSPAQVLYGTIKLSIVSDAG